MVNIEEKELEAINKYFGSYLESAVGFITKNLDVEAALTFEFSSTVSDLSEFQGTHAVCPLRSTEGYLGCGLMIVPEALISTISDIIMGGSGVDVYKGSLTELEINASAAMIEKFFDKMRASFKENYVKEVVLAAVPKFLDKTAKAYADTFTAGEFDSSIIYNLTINTDQEFKAVLLLNQEELIASLKNIHLLEDVVAPVEVQPMPISIAPAPPARMSTYDIRKLADVKIDMTAELGKAQVSIKQVLSLVRGSILELDTADGTDISVFANGSEVAKAQIVVVDGHFGIKITKILSSQERCKHL